ncbi:MAG: CDP-diacylglycerol--glycerol-3-phosphate 3-phosphatidyltransferase [Oscillospiraceae bacterium]|nr:CDP-diacylglycerol--glycerol-3-phosphate 3-phosphatidyltransferase [Oscillospiraceae bacterium]
MNLPNKLTVLRTLLVPVFLLFLLTPSIPGNYLWAFVVFAAASLTDFFDGRIARKYGMVTTFGKFLDPLADKVLVTCALVAFTALGLCPPVACILIIARDYMVSAIRLAAVSGEGKVIAANIWGKIKTALQMLVLCAAMLALFFVGTGALPAGPVAVAITAAMWVLAGVTALSGAVYLKQNIHLIDTFK